MVKEPTCAWCKRHSREKLSGRARVCPSCFRKWVEVSWRKYNCYQAAYKATPEEIDEVISEVLVNNFADAVGGLRMVVSDDKK